MVAAAQTTSAELRPREARAGARAPDPGLHREAARALEEGRIVPYYQPMFDLASGGIAGFEALARWEHVSRGLLEPGAFSFIFSDPHLAIAIGQRMLARIGADVVGWDAAGTVIGGVAINVSHEELRHGNFARSLDIRLKAIGLSADRVTVEITQDVEFGTGDGTVLDEVRRLHAFGISVALDDFGTGFASLTQLRQMPAERIKIDRSFISHIEDDPDDAAIVAGLIGLARRLGIQTVAEGVERPAQLAFLRAEGCDYAQGYLLGRPMPAAAVPHFVNGVRPSWLR